MNIDQETTARLREVMLEILDEFVRICEENNLVYFLTAGTLIGAVRHKGFIPWDDDIDVGMPRNDYNKFISLLQKDTGTNYSVHFMKYAPFYRYVKLCKKGTVLAETGVSNPKDYFGINIDIWPFDNTIPAFVPLQLKIITTSKKIYRLKTKNDIPKIKIKRFISNLFCSLLPLNFCRALLESSYSLFNKFNTGYITFLCGYYGNKKETHKYSTIYPLAKVCFENKEYYAPGKWDVFLSELYGDYMKLPPIEQQIGHDNRLFIKFDDKESI